MVFQSLPPGERERRIARIAPFFDYCRANGIVVQRTVTRMCLRRGDVPWSRQRIADMKRGRSPLPEWFVPDACEILRRPISEVMGSCWLRDDSRGQASRDTGKVRENARENARKAG